MSNISLAQRVQKLVTLCDQRGFQDLDDLLLVALLKDASPAICMTEGCNNTIDMEPDQDQGFCEACGGNTIISALVLAGLI
ncbi:MULTISPECIES: hypothetical protein [Bradyrhizobium]|uniref:Uncharacterized protein n=1 Tax=Bradyrhizobium barranii subsp. barranii TaxID=2823807 RepID=A0A939LYA5_9BRAD|nr:MULTISPECIES: hypothetical protein [Bradyrhizobium]MCP1747546.1 hypothetical protein [Bradyrhizobium japonicum]MCP1865178.1 hypothetical protein [Bradyrhizobium japonicum]MCP1896049.1 hypothetical protein [Bradyrhizobium japonicum]MCW2329435.1 hypothetical protein [Bradyrhizobium japonicum]UEM12415.1 hypothetical protein J4G43_049875 [Bradyrhizobium barranii subsp. barranii]